MDANPLPTRRCEEIISNEGQPERSRRKTNRQTVYREEMCGFVAGHYCYICNRHLCTQHYKTRHYGDHPKEGD